uniref:Origin recognition complex subunit 5 (inferred by orthology to a human protein) n=1 Tax=Strongyloides venezuelensis TaxID=75913 RepID=A0A0K0EZH7_STRVS
MRLRVDRTNIISKDHENVASFLLQPTQVLNHLHISGAVSPKEEKILQYIMDFNGHSEDYFDDTQYVVKDINLIMVDGSVQFLFETMFSKESEGETLKNIGDFIDLINSKKFVTNHKDKIVVILLRNAEYLGEFSSTFLKTFFDTPSHTDILFKFITVSKFPWYNISTRLGFNSLVMEVSLTPLDRSEMAESLFDTLEEDYGRRFKKDELEKFVDLFLGVTYAYCADYNNLLFLSRKCLEKITDDDLQISGKSAKNLSEVNQLISDILSYYYMGKRENTKTMKTIYLPTIAKYAIVASYCASFNPPSSDRRFFVKQHIKQRKTMHDVKRDPKNSLHELGPKNFTFDRFKMIFSYLLSKQNAINPLYVGTLDVLENLCNMGMLGRSLKQTNLEFPKYRSTLSKEFVEEIANSIDIILNDYLYDFASL